MGGRGVVLLWCALLTISGLHERRHTVDFAEFIEALARVGVWRFHKDKKSVQLKVEVAIMEVWGGR